MTEPLPQSILFCCDHNAVRSPMAEGLMKKFYGTGTYVQSAGVKGDMDIDGFSIAVCGELDIELARHQSRSFDQMEQWGDELSSFDLVVALSATSHRTAVELTKFFSLEVEHWPVIDPTAMGESREDKLRSYREARDQISKFIQDKFGPPAA
ncbi:MAG: low molecular weight phosphatase family protein [Planktomarina sp.]